MSSNGVDKKEKKMKKEKKENVESPDPMRIEKKSKKESKKRKALDVDTNDKENRGRSLNHAKPIIELEVQSAKKKSKKDKVEQEEKKKNVEEEAPNVVPVSKKKSKKDKIKQEERKNKVEEEAQNVVPVTKKKKKSKKAKVEQEEKKKTVEEEENSIAVSQFQISQPLSAKLKERGIKSLSPIQAMTFDTILDGFDLLGQAPAGQDKTLAFVLPIIETLLKGSVESKMTGSRAPSVIVLLPTRDLAIQVLKEFGFYGGSLGLVPCCVYGGSSHKVQTSKLRRGRVDIIVGTPGRVKDHINEGNIDLSSLKFRVLGEADELSKKGLVEHVEFILGKVNDVTKVQTLLFTTNKPRWVDEIAPSRYLKSDYKKVDLASNEKRKTN